MVSNACQNHTEWIFWLAEMLKQTKNGGEIAMVEKKETSQQNVG